MTPAARHAAAIGVLDRVFGGEPAEKALLNWARTSRFAGSKDRAAVRDIVFSVLRRKRSACWMGGARGDACSGRQAVLGLLVGAGADARAVFSGQGYAPPALSDAERAAMRDLDGAPRPVALDYPDFLDAELQRSLGGELEAAMRVLQGRAPVDLRVNTLRGTPEQALAALRGDGIEAEPLPGLETALRVSAGGRRIGQAEAYRNGLVELQDAASQMVVELAGAAPGATVLDYCAGGGGKTLALAAAMRNQGRLIAHDRDPGRMSDLPARGDRAGARIEISDTGGLTGLRGGCDLVLVDAPCSGSGAWRRMPDAKWRLTPARLEALGAAQRDAVEAALRYLAPHGRLIYATCSILACENRALLDGILARTPGLRRRRESTLLPGAPGDGFYCCELAFA